MEKSRTRSTLLIGLVVAFALAAMCLLAGCQGNNDEQKIKEVLNKELTINDQSIKSFTDGVGSVSEFEQMGIDINDFAKTLFEGYSYNIDSVKVNGNTATADVTFKIKDLKKAMQTAQTEIQNLAQTADVSDLDSLYKQAGQIIMTSLKNTSDMSTTTHTIDLTKDGSNWKVTDQNQLSTIGSKLFGDLSSL